MYQVSSWISLELRCAEDNSKKVIDAIYWQRRGISANYRITLNSLQFFTCDELCGRTDALLHSCTVALLHGCTVELSYFCTIAQLHGCTVAMLYGCTAALLHGCITD